ncbi:hypothetical protein [Streptomyces sp. NPDC006134]|uniref:hypothetical protein n=1 Tax=Streptomyces sp. NPDC006134 TaxID=3154467 RepID=UPI0034023917
MYTGLGLTVLAAAVPYADRSATHLMADHIRSGYPGYDQARIDTAVDAYVVLLSVVGVLGVVCWLGAAWAVRAGKRWARPASAVMLVFGIGVGLAELLTKDTSGATGLPPALGWVGMAPCLAGLWAVVLLWRRPQSA